MDHYGGIDVSLESSSLGVVDATGRIVCEAKISSDPEALTAWLKGPVAVALCRHEARRSAG
jgi:transposase